MLCILRLADSRYYSEYNIPDKFHLDHFTNIKEKCIKSVRY